MVKSIVVLMALVLVGAWMIGCDEDTPTDPGGGGTANRAPSTPTIDTGAGAPADGSTDRSTTSILHWECSDPDGDDLTFDVYFGQSDPPSSANTGQTAESYNPGPLAYSTTYYWKIVAKDPDGETASSAVWSFATMAQPSETVTTPTTPTGPATGTTAESLSFSTGGSTNSAGHVVQYRFDWGDGSFSVWSASTTVSYSWASAGTHTVKAQARCATHTNIESAWSAGHDVVISAATETVSTPDTPTGPTTGDTSENLRYDSGGATSSEGHTVEYRFDWDDGNISAWSTSDNRYHTFGTPGTYDVKAQARCRDHTSVESAWSGAVSVTITAAAEVIHRSVSSPDGPRNAQVGESLSYTLSTAATSSLGHDLEYQYDWRDGTFSAWSPTRDATHTWTVAGDYYIVVRARCAVHTSIISDPTPGTLVQITDAAETVSAPTHIAAEKATVTIDVDIWWTAGGSISSYGHDCEYRFDWADGTYSDWVGNGVRTLNSWADYGRYAVRAQGRCIADTLAVSDWSAIRYILIREYISVPTKPAGPTSGTVGATLTHTTGGATSGDGHPIEYQLQYYRMGTTIESDWSATPSFDHIFDAAGTYSVRARARCAIHTDAKGNVSDALNVTITAP